MGARERAARAYSSSSLIEVGEGTGDNSEGRWVRQTTETGGGVFYLQDHTGKVLIQPQNAEFDLFQTGQQQVMVTPASASAAGSGEAARQTVPGHTRVKPASQRVAGRDCAIPHQFLPGGRCGYYLFSSMVLLDEVERIRQLDGKLCCWLPAKIAELVAHI